MKTRVTPKGRTRVTSDLPHNPPSPSNSATTFWVVRSKYTCVALCGVGSWLWWRYLGSWLWGAFWGGPEQVHLWRYMSGAILGGGVYSTATRVSGCVAGVTLFVGNFPGTGSIFVSRAREAFVCYRERPSDDTPIMGSPRGRGEHCQQLRKDPPLRPPTATRPTRETGPPRRIDPSTRRG